MTILEGLAVGKPFISTDVGVVSAIPGGICCKDKTELVSAIKQLYENTQKREELAEIGKEYVETNCHVGVQVKKMEKVLFGTNKS